MTRRNLLLASTLSSGGCRIEFPIYLTIGDNGQLGQDVHSYIVSKFHEVAQSTYDITEPIYVNGVIVYSVYSNAPLEFVHNADINLLTPESYYVLSPTGVVIYALGGN